MTRFALPSTGSSWVSSPASQVLRRTPTPCCPSRRARCLARRYCICVRSRFAPRAVSAPHAAWGWSPDSHDRSIHRQRRQGLPGSWGIRALYVPQVHDPGGPPHQNWRSVKRYCLPLPTECRHLRCDNFGATPEARKASLCTLRRDGRPPPRNTRFLVRPASPGGADYPQGFLRKVSTDSVTCHSSSLPRLCLAHAGVNPAPTKRKGIRPDLT